MSREDPQLKIRLPADLKQHIEKAAQENHRSINAEVVARLESSFGDMPDPIHYELTTSIHLDADEQEQPRYSAEEVKSMMLASFEAIANGPYADQNRGPKPRSKYPKPK